MSGDRNSWAGGWNGWQYGQAQQQQQQSSSNSGNPNVNYVQLNWQDILGSQQGQGAVSTTGSSAFQYAPQQQASPMSTFQGYGYHQQQGGQQPPATFRISVGNQGDQSSYQVIQPGAPQEQQQQQQESTPAPTSGGDSGQSAKPQEPKYSACGNCNACKSLKTRPGNKPYIVRNGGHPKN